MSIVRALIQVPMRMQPSGNLGTLQIELRSLTREWSMYIGPAPLPEPPKSLFQKLFRMLRPKPERLSIRHVSGKPIRLSISRKVVLHRGGYMCPTCNAFSLKFESFGYFD